MSPQLVATRHMCITGLVQAVLPDFTICVSERLMDADVDGFTRQAISRYHGHSISLPDRFTPNPSFLVAHASRFGFV